MDPPPTPTPPSLIFNRTLQGRQVGSLSGYCLPSGECSSVQQTFTEHMPCALHCCRCQELGSSRNDRQLKKNSSPSFSIPSAPMALLEEHRPAPLQTAPRLGLSSVALWFVHLGQEHQKSVVFFWGHCFRKLMTLIVSFLERLTLTTWLRGCLPGFCIKSHIHYI